MPTRTHVLLAARGLRSEQENGFTVIETIVALGIILTALMALAYTAGIGFSDVALSRARQAASGLANEAMEEIRGLPFDTLKAGLNNADLTGDPNITQVGVNYFYGGEQIPHGDNLAVKPLVPHRNTVTEGTANVYTVSAYVTYYQNKVNANTFRVTVLVTWTNSSRGPVVARVQTQSLFYSGSGCLSPATHPFAAPCQPFFFGHASADEGHVTIMGDIEALPLKEAVVSPGGATSDQQVEQTSSAQGTTETSGVSTLDDSGTLQVVGLQQVTSGAENDPGQPGQVYNTVAAPSQSSQNVSIPGSGGSTLTLTTSAGDTGTTISTTSASLSPPNNCANPQGTFQTDGLPCGSSIANQNGTETAALTLYKETKRLGTALLVSIGASPSQAVAYTNRALLPKLTTCPLTTGDGCLHSEAARAWGQVTLAGLPDGLDATAIPAGWSGYLVAGTSLTASAKAEAGIGSAVPTATTSGTVWYWTGAGYAPLTVVAGAAVPIPVAPVHVVTTINGKPVIIDISASLTTGGTKVTDPAACVLPCTRTTASSSASSPIIGSITYVITYDGLTLANLSIDVDLGLTTAKGTYQVAPSA